MFVDQKEKQIKDLEKERDTLALNSEAMAEKLRENKIDMPDLKVEGKAE